ncbi:MAG TPA: hypothetical protein VED20_05940 [Streptosporangiaceae bacterium]|nr:hypothetical protein [Streptosporangiaceae bacterium]
MTFMTSGSGPARRRARYVAGGVAVAGLLAAAVVGSDAIGAAAAVTPGSLDTAFGSGGIAAASLPQGDGPRGVALQEPNGDIVVALNQGVARFLPNGQLDPSFGTGGIASGVFVSSSAALAVQPDGKILVDGVNMAEPTFPQGLTRLNVDGTVDTTFGTDGTSGSIPAPAPFGSVTTSGLAVLVQPDGKILLAANAFRELGPRGRNSVSEGYVARLNADGSVDTTFGTGGLTLTPPPSDRFPSGLGLDAAGDIFALPGQSQVQPQPGVTELSPTGQLDATVTAAPLTATSAGYPVDTTNDQFVFSQNEHPSGLEGFIDPEIIRFTTAGTVASDTGLFPFTGTSLFVQDTVGTVAVLPNGQALAIGSHTLVRATGTTAATTEFAFARVNPDGTLDPTFGTGGTALTNLTDSSGGGFFALLPQSDGTVIAVGGTNGNALELARFNL